jgi:hypothetical protein
MQGGEEARSEAYLDVRCNDERRSQRRRWVFFSSLLGLTKGSPRRSTIKGGNIMAEIKVGDAAPDLALKGIGGKEYALAEFKGKKTVVLLFYVLDWTPG